MAGINGVGGYGAYQAQSSIGKKTDNKKSDADVKNMGIDKISETDKTNKLGKADNYGKTVGEPQLSEKAKKYYNDLKKKFGNYDFILVSSKEKENAKANAAKYANGYKTVVLIDEEKIERMATDEKYRKQYEGILMGAKTELSQMKASMEKSGANVKGYGMEVNDNGTASFFAVLKKSSADQKARIEKKAEAKKAEKKAEAKAEAKRNQKKKETERLDKKKASDNNKVSEDEDENLVTISANSIEELMKKIEEFSFNEKSNSVLTESEMSIGQNIDFRG